ncbi:MAG TPA: DNA polymerase III subunit gamma/tau [Dissulfurispiraceae bacterium]
MSYLVLARKWRPRTFEDLIGQEHVARILKNAIVQNKVAHAYIFSGPRGVGKTSTARILAKALNCVNGPTPEPCGECQSCTAVSDGSSIDVSEIDGASNTGVDNIRDLRERVRYAPSAGRFKVYIIDEVHMLSTSAFNALLKTLEEPPSHVIFVLATTEPKKIPPTVLSRCQHLPFRRISGQKIKERLGYISKAEGIKIESSALDMIARAADGGMRDSLTILDQIASFAEDITAAEVKDLLGITDVETLSQLTSAVLEGDRKGVLGTISALTDTGTDLKAFVRDLLQFVRDLLIAKITGDTEGVIDLSEEEQSAIKEIMNTAAEEHIALLLSELIKAEPGIRSAFYPRIALEMTLIRLSLLSHLKSVNEALRAIRGGGTGQEVAGADVRKRVQTEAHKTAGKEERARANATSTKSKDSPDAAPGIPDSKATPQPISRTIPRSGGPAVKLGLSEAWEAVLVRTDEENPPLASKLREGEFSIGEHGITIVFNGGLSVHAESVKENLAPLGKAVEELSGTKVTLRVETVKTKGVSRKDLKEKALQNPIVKEALELFEGRISDVIPINGKEGGDNVQKDAR